MSRIYTSVSLLKILPHDGDDDGGDDDGGYDIDYDDDDDNDDIVDDDGDDDCTVILFLYSGKCSFHCQATFTNNSYIPSP